MTEQQSSRELAVVPEAPPREIARMDTDSWVEVAKPIFALANRIYDTEFVPKGLRGSEPATAAAMLYGREIGLPPMTSLGGIHVIEGKPGLSAEQMRAMVFAAGHEIEFVESTGAMCTIRGRRRGQERWTAVTWTLDMARAAGLLGKHIWKSYPRTQLQARCTTELCRMIFPDVIHGFRSVEELQDMTGDDGQGPAAGEQPAGTTKVARKRASARKAAAAAPAAIAPASSTVPPLPGEPGYDETAEPVEGGEAGKANQSAEPTGEGAEPPSTSSDSPGSDAADDAPETSSEGAGADPGDQTGEPGEATGDVPAADDPGSPDREPAPRPVSRGQHRMLMGLFGGLDLTDDKDREERLLIASMIVGRELESTNDLTTAEAKTLIDTLSMVEKSREKLNALLDNIDQANAERAAAEAGDES